MKHSVTNIRIAIAAFCFSTVVSVNVVNAATLDQFQDNESLFGGIYEYSGRVSGAQTFTAGFDQALDRIDLLVGGLSGNVFNPVTITIREAVSGKPIGADLGSVSYDANGLNFGWFSFDFSAQSISLIQGRQYAMVISGEDPDPFDSNCTCFHSTLFPEHYLGGELWIKHASIGPDWILGEDLDYGSDLLFRTYGTSTVPLPAAAWLFGTGIIPLLGAAMRRRE
jgi:hypothetical protein